MWAQVCSLASSHFSVDVESIAAARYNCTNLEAPIMRNRSRFHSFSALFNARKNQHHKPMLQPLDTRPSFALPFFLRLTSLQPSDARPATQKIMMRCARPFRANKETTRPLHLQVMSIRRS